MAKTLTPIERAVLREYVARGIKVDSSTGPGPRRTWSLHAPQKKQAAFLALDDYEALYGGAAGGGKSDAILMGALEEVDQPGYAALVLRRTYADLALPGAIMDRADQWLRDTAAHWDGSEKTWRFPSGATLTFGYLATEKHKYRYQSSEFQYVGFDELTQFTETQYAYLSSRVRRPEGSPLRLRMRSASNPGGIGHDWVYRRFVNPKTKTGAFVPATLEDNAYIDKAAYRISLSKLDETTRLQLEKGLWVRDAGGLVYKFDATRNLIAELPRAADGMPFEWHKIFSVDFGASEKKPTTAMVIWAFSYQFEAAFMLESEKHAGMTTTTIARRRKELDAKHKGFTREVGDQGALGAGYIKELRDRWAIPIVGAQKQNKLGYRKLFNGDLQAEPPRIFILEGANDAWLEEAQELSWNDKGTDNIEGQANHVSDAGLYGWREAKHFLAEAEESLPEAGSAEYHEARAAEMRERAIERVSKRKRRSEDDILDLGELA
jgi:hypothetical protein